MRWEERAALEANRQIEEQERKVRSMSELMRQALMPAREAGFSATELGDGWYLPADFIRRETDLRHVKKVY